MCQLKSITRFIFGNYSLIEPEIIEQKFSRIKEVGLEARDKKEAKHRGDVSQDYEHKKGIRDHRGAQDQPGSQ